jgi:hypothetical protein
VSIIPQVALAIYIYIYHRFSAQLRIMNNGDFIVNLDFPKNGTERGTWNSPVKDVLYQMREIFKRLPKDDWFTYISKLLPLLDEDCVDEDIYDSLEDLIDQHPCLIQFHRLLVEEFVPELVKTRRSSSRFYRDFTLILLVPMRLRWLVIQSFQSSLMGLHTLCDSIRVVQVQQRTTAWMMHLHIPILYPSYVSALSYLIFWDIDS